MTVVKKVYDTGYRVSIKPVSAIDILVPIDLDWRRNIQKDDVQHNDTQHNDTQHNYTQHNVTQHNDTQHCDTQHYVTSEHWNTVELSVLI